MVRVGTEDAVSRLLRCYYGRENGNENDNIIPDGGPTATCITTIVIRSGGIQGLDYHVSLQVGRIYSYAHEAKSPTLFDTRCSTHTLSFFCLKTVQGIGWKSIGLGVV